MIPCVEGDENAWEYEDFAYLGGEFTGRFENFPDDYPFELQEIIVDSDDDVNETDPWPIEPSYGMDTSEIKLSVLKRNHLCGLFRLTTHRIISGLSKLQEAMMDSKTSHGPILVHEISTKFGVAVETVQAQLDLMKRGNRPMIIQNGRFIERQPRVATFPYYLINGPFPLSPEKVVHAIQALIDEHYQRSTSAASPPKLDMIPTCPNVRFTIATRGNHASVSYLDANGRCRPPYSGSLDGIKVETITPGGIVHGELVNRPSHPILPDWVFLDGPNVGKTDSPLDYLVEWLTATSAFLLENQVDRLKYAVNETRFLSHIFHGHLVEKQDLTRGMFTRHRVYLDESEESRKETIKNMYGGYYELEDLPIRKLSSRIMLDEEPSVQSFNALGEIKKAMLSV